MKTRDKIRSSIRGYLNERINRVNKQSRLISENILNGRDIINVDIQPEYENWITFNISDWVNFINSNGDKNEIIFLYNGADTLGMIDEGTYKQWLFDLGIEEDIIYNATYYDKGYAFFRYCMDSNIDERAISNLVKFMIKNNINDSRDITSDFWNEFRNEYKDDDYSTGELRDLLENASDMINIPDLMDFLKGYTNIVLCGGGINECLKEVEIALLSLDKGYNVLSEFVY